MNETKDGNPNGTVGPTFEHGQHRLASAGFTIACDYPQCGLSVYAVDHSICEILFPPLENSISFQNFLVEQARKRVIGSVGSRGNIFKADNHNRQQFVQARFTFVHKVDNTV